MPSLRSRMFLFMMRHRHLMEGHLKPSSLVDSPTPIEDFRALVAKGAKMLGKVPDDITVEQVTIGQINAEWLRLATAPAHRVILYFHGGGYICGSSALHRMHVAKVVQGSGTNALVFDYRLAPEHPFPAAIDDALAAYQWLLDQGFAAHDIAFMGDSAGGGLCLATLVALRDEQFPLPASAVALSPWTDLTCTGESFRTNAKTCLSPPDSWIIFSRAYAGETDPTHPWMSPLYAELHDLPPLLIFASSNEVMRSDAERFAAKAQAAGVTATAHIGDRLLHCYPVCAPMFPEATDAMTSLCGFINAQFNGA